MDSTCDQPDHQNHLLEKFWEHENHLDGTESRGEMASADCVLIGACRVLMTPYSLVKEKKFLGHWVCEYLY